MTSRIRLVFFCISPDYPMQAIRLYVNETEIPHQARWNDPRWFTLETVPIHTDNDRNILLIEPPSYISPRLDDPGTDDVRYLSIALQSVEFLR